MGPHNSMWYVGKFDEASGSSSARVSGGRTSREMIWHGGRQQHIEYKRELLAYDIITIRSAVLGVRDKAIRMTHEMRNDETGEVTATTVVAGVYLDATVSSFVAHRRAGARRADDR